MIHSGVSEEELQSSFEDLNLKTNEKSSDAPRGVEDLLGQPWGKFDYKVFHTKPSSSNIPLEAMVPTEWRDEFEDEDNKGYNVRIDDTEMNHGHRE